GVAVLRRGEDVVERRQLGIAGSGEAGGQQRDALVRARLDEGGDQQRVEQAARLAAAHLGQEAARGTQPRRAMSAATWTAWLVSSCARRVRTPTESPRCG